MAMHGGSLRRGWLEIPGVQTGDRTVEEQMIGLGPALAECKDKMILDLGCAEGLIGREFAKVGAKEVLGVDVVGGHIGVARFECRGLPMRFQVRDLNKTKPPKETRNAFDIVLALAVLHKLETPKRGVWYCAQSAKLDRSLIVVRLPHDSDGLIFGKHSGISCYVPDAMHAEGFDLEHAEPGPRGELVQYYRRAC